MRGRPYTAQCPNTDSSGYNECTVCRGLPKRARRGKMIVVGALTDLQSVG